MGKSSVKNSSASKLIRPSSVRKQGIPMDPLALIELKAGDESRRWRNSFRFLTCSPMSIRWKLGLPESFAVTRGQSGQLDIIYTLVIVVFKTQRTLMAAFSAKILKFHHQSIFDSGTGELKTYYTTGFSTGT